MLLLLVCDHQAVLRVDGLQNRHASATRCCGIGPAFRSSQRIRQSVFSCADKLVVGVQKTSPDLRTERPTLMSLSGLPSWNEEVQVRCRKHAGVGPTFRHDDSWSIRGWTCAISSIDRPAALYAVAACSSCIIASRKLASLSAVWHLQATVVDNILSACQGSAGSQGDLAGCQLQHGAGVLKVG